MTHRAYSFRLRLILAATVWIGIGLAASWVGLHEILRGHLEAEFHEELLHHAAELGGLVTVAPDGQLMLRHDLSDRRFFEPGSGHYWQVLRSTALPGGGPPQGDAPLRSASLGAAVLRMPPAEAGPPRVLSLDGPTGALRLLVQELRPAGTDATVTIAVGVDASVVDSLLHRFDISLALALAVIAAGLVAAVIAQVTFGLSPMARVRDGLAAIRLGQANRLPDDLPVEVAPLAASLNGMIQANDDVVRRARIQAGNLAHALQTPLAVLIDEGRRLQAAGADGSAVLREAERMRRRIEYHLAHARAAASRGRPHAASAVVPALRGLVLAVSRLHRERNIDFELDAEADDVMAACETEDLEEMAGNLIDNAAKWAASRVRVSAGLSPTGTVCVLVDDDGPGMPPEARERAFQPGQRLDEHVAGHGLGLAIVRDVAELYGGRVAITTSDLGGARVALELPTAA